MNGDSHETGKLTPDGEPDPSVFSTEHNREGIQVGTAIALLVRRATTPVTMSVHFRRLLGPGQAGDWRVAQLRSARSTPYEELSPTAANRFSFEPIATSLSTTAPGRGSLDLAGVAPSVGFREATMARSSTSIVRALGRAHASLLRSSDLLARSCRVAASGSRRRTGRVRRGRDAPAICWQPGSSMRPNIAPIRLSGRSTSMGLLGRRLDLCGTSRARAWSVKRGTATVFLLVRRLAPRSADASTIPVDVTSAVADYHLLQPNVDRDSLPLALGDAGDRRLISCEAACPPEPRLQRSVRDASRTSTLRVRCRDDLCCTCCRDCSLPGLPATRTPTASARTGPASRSPPRPTPFSPRPISAAESRHSSMSSPPSTRSPPAPSATSCVRSVSLGRPTVARSTPAPATSPSPPAGGMPAKAA